MPRDEEASECVRRNGLHFAPEPRERAAAESPEHVGIDPLAFDAAWPELSLHEPSGLGQARQQRLGDRRAQAESPRERVDGERTMRAGESQREITGRIADGFEERVRKAWWQACAEAVAVSCGVFHRDVRVAHRRSEWRRFVRARSSSAIAAAVSGIDERAWISSSVRSPIRSSRSWMPSGVFTRRLSSRY